MFVDVFQRKHAIGDDAEFGAVTDFHPPMQRRFDEQI